MPSLNLILTTSNNDSLNELVVLMPGVHDRSAATRRAILEALDVYRAKSVDDSARRKAVLEQMK